MIEYRAVDGFPGYRVGDNGSVWCCLARGGRQCGVLTGNWRPLKPGVKKGDGHLVVTLSKNGELTTRFVHHLVLEAFVGPCPEGQEALHGDGNPANNSIGNLRWGTHQENVADSQRHGTQPHGSKHMNAKLVEDDVREIRKAYEQGGETITSLARRYKVARSVIRTIVKRTAWKHVE